MLNRVLKPIVRRVINGSRQYHDVHIKPSSLDEAFVPEGSWQENHKKLQTKYNLQLLTSIVLFTSTVLTAYTYELLYFNWGPPKPKKSE